MWNFISYKKRMELTKKYEIKPSAPREVANNKLVKDGVLEQDLEMVPSEVLHEVSGIPAIKEEKAKKKEAKKLSEKKDEGKSEKKAKDKGSKSSS